MNTTDNLPPVHPGEYIADGLEELKINQVQLAQILGCSKQLINDIIKGRKGLSMDICLKLPVVMGSTAEFWSDLQQRYDLKIAAEDKKMIAAIYKAQEAFGAILAKDSVPVTPLRKRSAA